ncbi:MAG: carbohydrate ABC transporter permease [Gaiellaceae bacterium]
MSVPVPVAPVRVAPAAAIDRRRARRRLNRRRITRRIVLNLVGLLVFAVMVFPVYWMVSTAFKPGLDILSYTPKWIPRPATLANFRDAIGKPYFWDNVRNSVIIVGVVVALSLVLAFLAALALAKFRFYGRTAFIVLVIGVQMVPLNALIIPLYILLARTEQVNKLSGVIATYLTFVLPFCVWTLRGFMLGVPAELEEAAMVDGSTRFGAFVRILLPLVAPGLVATSIFAFIQAWNEFIIAYVLLSSPEKQTLTVWLASFTSLRGTDWGSLMAGATLTAIPVVVFFVAVHRRIAFGLTAGAVRG